MTTRCWDMNTDVAFVVSLKLASCYWELWRELTPNLPTGLWKACGSWEQECLKRFVDFLVFFSFFAVLSVDQNLNHLLEKSTSQLVGKQTHILPHLSRASLKLFLWTSNWKTVLSQSVEALSLPPCFLRKASKPFSEGYFSLPINTTGTQQRCSRGETGRGNQSENQNIKGNK